uniref:Uncharacterized protein n=1 Tax=Ascaris lumbricoides TaxID=6252 RepID=A0A0M3IR50_ASCLU
MLFYIVYSHNIFDITTLFVYSILLSNIYATSELQRISRRELFELNEQWSLNGGGRLSTRSSTYIIYATGSQYFL